MKLKQLTVALLLIIGATLSLQAQFLDKIIKRTERKIEQEEENRTQKQIDKKIDKVFDETEESLEGVIKNGSSSGDGTEVAEAESSYSFDVTATMLITSYNKKKESYTKMKQSYGTNALLSEVNVDQKMLFITDFNNDLAVMINPEAKSATIMSMAMMRKFMSSEEEAEENTTAKMIKTGATKMINGYKCYQYIITDKKLKIDAWFAPDVDFNYQKHLGGFAKMFGKNNDSSTLLNKGNGYVMEFVFYEKGEKKAEMKVTDFSKTPITITMNEYTIQTMF